MKETDMNGTLRQSKVEKRLYTITECAVYLGRSPWAVRHLVWRGVLPAVRVGRRVQVDVRDMDTLIERNKYGDGG